MMTLSRVSVSPAAFKPHVLIVDDDERVLDSLRRALSGRGYRVRVARDGGEALTLMQERVFDAVLSEVDLPVLDGVALAETMSDLEFDVPLIFISSHARLAANAVPGSPVLQKPVNPDELDRALRTAIHLDDLLDIL